MLGLLFGMRCSEALGLRWSDIDLEKQTIVISYTMTQMRTLLIDEHSKSATSHRMLSVMDDVIGYFKRLKAQQKANKREYLCIYYSVPVIPGRFFATNISLHSWIKLI